MGAPYRTSAISAAKLASGLFVFLSVLAASAESQDLPPEALAVLKRFLGDWKTQTRIHHVGPPPREIDTKGKAACQQTLEGCFFEFRTQTIPPGQADLQIMTFDAKAGVYRQWVFASDGYCHEAEGSWNPTTSILRWTGKSSGTSFVIDDHWISSDRLEWTLRRTDAKGKPLQTISGAINRAQGQ